MGKSDSSYSPGFFLSFNTNTHAHSHGISPRTLGQIARWAWGPGGFLGSAALAPNTLAFQVTHENIIKLGTPEGQELGFTPTALDRAGAP